MAAKIKVAILGSTGMLGSMVRRVLAERREYELVVIDRLAFPERDCALADSATLAFLLAGCQYAINCIGVIKPRIDEGSAKSVEQAVRVNSMFPHTLAAAAERTGCRVLQIATDCVFSGATGGYTESSHTTRSMFTARPNRLARSLLPTSTICAARSLGRSSKVDQKIRCWSGSWGSQQDDAEGIHKPSVEWDHDSGIRNICHGIMSQEIELPCKQHVVPRNTITKCRTPVSLRLFLQPR